MQKSAYVKPMFSKYRHLRKRQYGQQSRLTAPKETRPTTTTLNAVMLTGTLITMHLRVYGARTKQAFYCGISWFISIGPQLKNSGIKRAEEHNAIDDQNVIELDVAKRYAIIKR
uniref:Uncharacterized protein n=1 Tax=Glossina palpalis gambiensis TaxID=67801 RepID=A0A1B0BF84_9MUSC